MSVRLHVIDSSSVSSGWSARRPSSSLVRLGARAPAAAPPRRRSPLPNKPDTLHFAVIGDNGTGDKPQYDIGEQLADWSRRASSSRWS